MIIIDVPQQSPEWFEARRGVFTASMASTILTPTGKPSTTFEAEIGRLIAERAGWHDPEPEAPFKSVWMERGNEVEEEARFWFSVETGYTVEEVGFILDESTLVGASPDGVIRFGDPLIPVELKCPKPSTHAQWLLKGELPSSHVAQVHFQMALMKAPFAYFMSYFPGARPLLLKVERSDYTEKMAARIQDYIAAFPEYYQMVTGEEFINIATGEE